MSSFRSYFFILAITLPLTGCFLGTGLVQENNYPQRIMSRGGATTSQMASMLLQTNPALKERAWEMAALYRQEAAFEGVNSDIAFVQMCLETSYLRFGGQVLPSQYNFCGLGAVDGGGRGYAATFGSPREGVRAHIQHLKAYGCTTPLRNPNVDPRFHLVTRGSAREVRGLTKRWASDPNYHLKLNKMLEKLYNQPNQL